MHLPLLWSQMDGLRVGALHSVSRNLCRGFCQQLDIAASPLGSVVSTSVRMSRQLCKIKHLALVAALYRMMVRVVKVIPSLGSMESFSAVNRQRRGQEWVVLLCCLDEPGVVMAMRDGFLQSSLSKIAFPHNRDTILAVLSVYPDTWQHNVLYTLTSLGQ